MIGLECNFIWLSINNEIVGSSKGDNTNDEYGSATLTKFGESAIGLVSKTQY